MLQHVHTSPIDLAACDAGLQKGSVMVHDSCSTHKIVHSLQLAAEDNCKEVQQKCIHEWRAAAYTQ